MKLATAVALSRNKKTGPVAATYAAQSSCPQSCPMLGAGCYAERGRVALVHRRFGTAKPVEVARAEAESIRSLRPLPGLPLRLHVVGDCPDDESAQIVSAAAASYERSGGGRAWTYSHAWRSVARASWGRVSVLASLHSADEGRDAIGRGYAPALVVEAFPGGHSSWIEAGIRWIACPEQRTGRRDCASCRLCFDADGLRKRGQGIAFAKH
jgi:hypothetical protein